MKIQLWSIGKAHESYVKQGIEDFTNRVSKYYPVEWKILSPAKQTINSTIPDIKKQEALAITQALQKDDYLVLLDEQGTQLTSPALAKWLQQRANESTRQLIFLIGGAYGVDDSIFSRANYKWSLSNLVFPHQLVRLILAEQVYRRLHHQPQREIPSCLNSYLARMLSITLVIVILTAIISFTALSNEKVIDDLIFYPPSITNQNQWYRFFSCALIHADLPHLLFNMWGLYIFGKNLEVAFEYIFPGKAGFLFVALYLFAQFFCLVPTYLKNKENYHYKSLGASGAVSGVVFASIMLFPTAKLGLLFLPIKIPGFIFGFIYLGISYYMAKKGTDNINHEAHFWGALAGVIFLIVSCYAFSTFDPIANFVGELRTFMQ